MSDRVRAPEAVLREVLALDPGLRQEAYYGERAVFFNPGAAAPLGVIVAAVKERDGPNDRAALLDREGVYRFAFGMAPDAFARRFGGVPPRPGKGEAVALPGHDLTRLDELTPHPVYAWMSWVQVLSPSPATFAALRPLLGDSVAAARAKWARRVHDSPRAR